MTQAPQTSVSANTKSDAPILLTGVSQRIGFDCALALVKQGYPVIGSYRSEHKNAENLAQLNAAGVRLIQADFASREGIEQFIQRVLSEYDHLRAVIHNASSWAKDEPDQSIASQFDLAQQLLAVHTLAPYLMNLAFAPLLQEKFTESGSKPNAQPQQVAPSPLRDIIHITDYVVQSGSDHHIAYAASKAALENMTLSFARRLAPSVKVNSIAPSLIMFNDHDDAAYRQRALAKSLLGIEPGAQVVIDTLTYILHNPYLTGQCIQLEGGRAIRQS